MDTVIVTGAAGLVGSATVRAFAARGYAVVGVDNDARAAYFGPEASTAPTRRALEASVAGYVHHDADIRDADAIDALFADHGGDVRCVVHAAAQPSHDWAARDPRSDFAVNAQGTLNLLEATRRHAPGATFIFTSTNKVYGDNPNRLPLVEQETRWEVDAGHPYFAHGIDETMSVDRCTHSLFGCSKLAADVMVQEYARCYGLNTVCFRAGCITGPAHAGVQLHGFLSYLVKCAVAGRRYSVFGYGGKQVRDNLHADDLAAMFLCFHAAPRPGEIYNVGGGRRSHCSLREAAAAVERLTGKALRAEYQAEARRGDHVWYVSDTRKFESHYPDWRPAYDLERTLVELCEAAS